MFFLKNQSSQGWQKCEFSKMLPGPTAIFLHLHFPNALFFRLGLFSNSPDRNYRVFFFISTLF